jgi:hypothetical protein
MVNMTSFTLIPCLFQRPISLPNRRIQLNPSNILSILAFVLLAYYLSFIDLHVARANGFDGFYDAGKFSNVLVLGGNKCATKE